MALITSSCRYLDIAHTFTIKTVTTNSCPSIQSGVFYSFGNTPPPKKKKKRKEKRPEQQPPRVFEGERVYVDGSFSLV